MQKPKKQNKGPGQPSKLTKTLALRIRKLYLSGKKVKDIQLELGIKAKTWEHWFLVNTHGFRTDFAAWRREKMLNRFEENLHEFSEMPTEIQDIEDSDDENGPRAVVVTDPRLVKIKLDATTYGLDTLGKEHYSKKLLVEDPDAARKDEVEDLRQTVKKMINSQRGKYIPSHKQKMAGALK